MRNMYSLAALLAFVSLAEARPFPVGIRPSISFDPYILGGQDAAPGEFPWQLSMLRSGSHSCGASLLSSISALTVAHCVDGALVSTVDVIAGLHQRSDLTGTQTSAAASFTIHPNYDNGAGTFADDIAIIEVATAIDTSPSHIEPMILPPDNSEQFVGVTCTLSGWGRTSASNFLSDTLQKADIPAISTAECELRMIGAVGASCSDQRLAVYDDAEQKGACSGDSGGPMNCPLGDQIVVAGVTAFIVSDGNTCLPSYPTIGTRTGSYLQWIRDNTP